MLKVSENGMLCDFCSNHAVFSIADEYHYKDSSGYLRVRSLPGKSVCREHEKFIKKVVYYSEELNGERH